MWKYRIKFASNYYANALEVVGEKRVKPDPPPNSADKATLKKYKDDLTYY